VVDEVVQVVAAVAVVAALLPARRLPQQVADEAVLVVPVVDVVQRVLPRRPADSVARRLLRQMVQELLRFPRFQMPMAQLPQLGGAVPQGAVVVAQPQQAAAVVAVAVVPQRLLRARRFS
jgi:hypothetical protein